MKQILLVFSVCCIISASSAKEGCGTLPSTHHEEVTVDPVQSCDPNEIRGPLGSGIKQYVLQGEWMNYTIYFENKTNATAAGRVS